MILSWTQCYPPCEVPDNTVPKVVKVILEEEVLENFINFPLLQGCYMALLYGSDWLFSSNDQALFSCNDWALLARCPRHIP